MLHSHDFIFETLLLLDLWITRSNSLINFSLQLTTLGCESLKSPSFLSIHMHQHMIIIISIAKGTLSNLLICLVALVGFNHMGTLTPICIQQFLANEHLKKGASIFLVFVVDKAHNHRNPIAYFFLFSRLLVLSMFLSNSHKKYLVFLLTSRIPNPFKSRVYWPRSYHRFICS
jgi:hypothetical protein